MRLPLALLLATGVAAADPVPSRARELADHGRTFYDARDYPRAIEAFTAAYVIAPSPGLLFDLAQSYRLSGDCDEAAAMYRRYLDADPYGDGRDVAAAHLRTLEHCTHDGPPLPPSGRSPGHDERVLGISLATGGAALLLGAAWFAVDAHEASDDVTAAYAKGARWSDIASANARGEHSAEVATALGIGGGVALAAGAICFGLGVRAEHEREIAVQPNLHGGTVSVRWTW